MTIFQAIIIGIVQGLTEFIPVSSTAHLIFASKALDLFGGAGAQLQAEQTTATIAVVQLGTLLAVLIYFAPDILTITVAFIRDHLAMLAGGGTRPRESRGASGAIVGRRSRLSDDARLGWLVVVGSIAVGCAQVLALIPGASRSGSTIMGGLFAGEKRETAARFSFLLSIPAIAASGLLELKEAIHKLPEGSALPLVVATVTAGIVGYASIWLLLRYLRTHSTAVFIVYRLALGAALLFMLWRGAIRP